MQDEQTPHRSIFAAYAEQVKHIIDPEDYQTALAHFCELAQQAQNVCIECESEVDKIQAIVDFFYGDAIFSTPMLKIAMPDNHEFDLLKSVQYRTAQPIVLSALLLDFFNLNNLDADWIQVANIPLIRLNLAEEQFVFIDAITGASLEWENVSEMLSEAKVESLDNIEHSQRDIVFDLIKSLKAVLLARGEFEIAHAYCELLVSLDPNDPYLRRDRGYLFEQLQCKPHAIADYEYFIEQCPDDPIAKMVQGQLSELAKQKWVVH